VGSVMAFQDPCHVFGSGSIGYGLVSLEAGMSNDFNPLLLVLGLRLDEPSYEPSTESLSSECGIILSQLF
jgi:hypothetical protein